MRIAVYHNLPAGGAFRVVAEFLKAVCDPIECTLFTLDGRGTALQQLEPPRPTEGIGDVTTVSAPVPPDRWSTWAGRRAAGLDLLRGIRTAEGLVAERINEGEYDCALVHPSWATQAPWLLSQLRVPSVYYMHEVRRRTFEPGYSPSTLPRTFRAMPSRLVAAYVESQLVRGDKSAVRHAGALACNSRYTAGSIHRHYGRTATVCHPGVDMELFHPHPELSRDALVLSVGGLEPFKGHHEVVAALARIPLRSRPRLGLVYERCEPRYRTELLDLASYVGVQVEEHRAVSDQSLAQLYSRACATVLAARLEPFGLVALESMACGTPVVAVAEAGYLETVVPDLNGFLVDREPDAIARAIIGTLNGELGDEDAIRASVTHRWSWSSAAREVVRLLTRMAEERTS